MRELVRMTEIREILPRWGIFRRERRNDASVREGEHFRYQEHYQEMYASWSIHRLSSVASGAVLSQISGTFCLSGSFYLSGTSRHNATFFLSSKYCCNAMRRCLLCWRKIGMNELKSKSNQTF